MQAFCSILLQASIQGQPPPLTRRADRFNTVTSGLALATWLACEGNLPTSWAIAGFLISLHLLRCVAHTEEDEIIKEGRIEDIESHELKILCEEGAENSYYAAPQLPQRKSLP